MSRAGGHAVDELAAGFIAEDVARTHMLERPAKIIATPSNAADQQRPRWMMIGGVGVLAIMLLGSGAVVIASLGGAVPVATPPAVAPATLTPAPTSSAVPTITATVAPTPSASPTATPTPPLVSGESLAYGEFVRTSGNCPYADQFGAQFQYLALDGELTIIQLPGNHTTTGSLTRTGLSEATFVTTAENQSYEGTITGSTVRGSHRYTGEGCDDVWSFTLTLLRPFVAPAPADAVPAFFEFLDSSTFEQELQLTGGQSIHLVVGSSGDPDMTMLLPIRVILYVGDETPWDMLITGDPRTVCRGPDGCSIDAPGSVDPAWLAPGEYPLLVAFAADGTLLAVHAQNGMPADGLPPTHMPPP